MLLPERHGRGGTSASSGLARFIPWLSKVTSSVVPLKMGRFDEPLTRYCSTQSLLARNRVPIRFRFGCSASGAGGSIHCTVVCRCHDESGLKYMHRTRHSPRQRAVISCEQLLMSYDSVPCHHGGRYQCRRHSGCCGSGVPGSGRRFDGTMGELQIESATRQWAASVPWARCRHRPVGPGRRDGPTAGLGYSSSEAY
jgi:hypothetical protein